MTEQIEKMPIMVRRVKSLSSQFADGKGLTAGSKRASSPTS